MPDREQITVPLPNWKGLADHPIKISFVLVVGTVAFLLNLQPWARSELAVTFFTKAEAEEHSRDITGRLGAMQRDIDETKTTLDVLAFEVRLTAALAIVRNAEEDLRRFTALRPPDSGSTWERDKTALAGRLQLAKDYRKCVVDGGKKCEELRKQVFQ